MKISCVITDDEPLARKGMEKMVREIPFLELEASCSNPLEVIEISLRKKIDLLFLDIQMPRMSGIDFLRNFREIPAIIITSAFPNYALEGYELNVMDYLLKPIPFDRFYRSCKKAYDYFEVQEKLTQGRQLPDDHFFIRCDSRYEKIVFDEVLFIEAMENYVIIHTARKKYITYLTFKAMEGQLPAERFIKVHKSFIVAANKVDNIDGNEINIGTHRITISRSMKEEVLDKLVNRKLLKRKD